MELKIEVHSLLIKDHNSGEEFTCQTVRTAEEVASIIDETEKDALDSAVYRLRGEY